MTHVVGGAVSVLKQCHKIFRQYKFCKVQNRSIFFFYITNAYTARFADTKEKENTHHYKINTYVAPKIFAWAQMFF